MTRIVAIVMLAFFIVTEGPIQAQPTPTKLVLSVHKTEGFHNAFWDALKDGAQQEAWDQGVELAYVAVPPAFAQDPAAGQAAVVRQALKAGVAGVVITPGDRLKLVAVVQEAVLAGVPVVCIDAPIESTLLSAIVATNNYQGGLAAARRMATRMGATGRVVVLSHPSAAQNQAIHDRLEAFASGLRQFAPGIQILSDNRAGQATPETDAVVAEGLLRDYPEATGFYAVSGGGLIGALRALRATGRAGKVTLIGWDADAESLQGLRNAEVDAILQQDPRAMGRLGVRAVLDAIRGKAPNRSVGIEATLLTRDTLETPRARELLK